MAHGTMGGHQIANVPRCCYVYHHYYYFQRD